MPVYASAVCHSSPESRPLPCEGQVSARHHPTPRTSYLIHRHYDTGPHETKEGTRLARWLVASRRRRHFVILFCLLTCQTSLQKGQNQIQLPHQRTTVYLSTNGVSPKLVPSQKVRSISKQVPNPTDTPCFRTICPWSGQALTKGPGLGSTLTLRQSWRLHAFCFKFSINRLGGLSSAV